MSSTRIALPLKSSGTKGRRDVWLGERRRVIQLARNRQQLRHRLQVRFVSTSCSSYPGCYCLCGERMQPPFTRTTTTNYRFPLLCAATRPTLREVLRLRDTIALRAYPSQYRGRILLNSISTTSVMLCKHLGTRRRETGSTHDLRYE